MLTLLTTLTSIAIAVPAPRDLQSEDTKGLQHDEKAPSLYNDHQAEGADKFSPPGNGSAAASKHEIAMAAPVDVGYDPCFEGQDVCKKWCAKNTKSWPNKCTFSKYCAGCTQCSSVDDEQAFCLAVTAPWATKCTWATCHGHAQCSDGTVPCESEPPSTPVSTPPSTNIPTQTPTMSPTASPTASPTSSPTASPTASPTGTPTGTPTKMPTNTPTQIPTLSPTASPTASPTSSPTASPTAPPTKTPTKTCSENIVFNPTETYAVGTAPNPDRAMVYSGRTDASGMGWTHSFCFRAYPEEPLGVAGVKAYTISEKTPYPHRTWIKEGTAAETGWSKVFTFWAFASEQPGTNKINVGQRSNPDRNYYFVDSEPTSPWDQIATFWAYPCESTAPTAVVLKDGTTTDLRGAIESCVDDGYSEECYITKVGCAPNAWDVSAVTNMGEVSGGGAGVFYRSKYFNQDLAAWDVSAVKDMKVMFYAAEYFNQDLAAWDVSAVTSMHAMFYLAKSFNQGLADWDVSAVTDSSSMFTSSYSFNQGLADWDVSGVKSMQIMFSGATPFNGGIADWDVSGVTDMAAMFKQTWFNQDLADWDVSAVTAMGNMFYKVTLFNQDLADWDVSAVKVMRNMFKGSPMSCNSVPTKFQSDTACTA